MKKKVKSLIVKIVCLLIASNLTFSAWSVQPDKDLTKLRIEPTEEAFRDALKTMAANGGGIITFNTKNSFIDIKDRIDYIGDNLTIDGEDRNITFRYKGPDVFPSQIEGQDHLLRFFGDNNTLKNFTIYGFPEGVKAMSGNNILFENLKFPIVGEDAISVTGSGFVAFNVIIRNCYFENSEDKTIMINNGGSILVENCEFVNTTQPVRAGSQTGHYTIRNNIFRLDPTRPQHKRPDGNPRSGGPRFNGGNINHIVVFEDNTVIGTEYGIRVYGNVNAIIRNNTFENCNIGVLIFNTAKVRLIANRILNSAQNGVAIQNTAQVDLGGGSVQINGDSSPSRGGNIIKGNKAMDVVNESENEVFAKNNSWDHNKSEEVQRYDVTGKVIVDPLGSK